MSRVRNINPWQVVLALWALVGGCALCYGAEVTPAAHWKLDEASGAMVDVVGGLTLTEQSGTIDAATGKVGGARDWEAGDTESAEVADNATLSGGNRTHGVAFWINPETTSNTGVLMHKGWQATPDANREWVLFFSSATTLRLTFSNSGTAFTNLDYTNVSLSPGNWYFVCVWYDADANTFNISINDNAVQSVSDSLGTYDGNRAFVLGASPNQTLYYDGIIDEVSWFSGNFPNAAQRTFLYNAGNGRAWPWSSRVLHTHAAMLGR